VGVLQTVWLVVAAHVLVSHSRRKRLQAVDKKLTKFGSLLANIMWFRGRALFRSPVLQA
jgi:hypothetical protein